MRPPPFVVRSLARLALAGLAVLAAVSASGLVLEWQRFGPDEAVARARIARRVAASVQDLETSLQRVVDRVRVDPSRVPLAAQGESAAERELFDTIERAPDPRGPAVAATIYGTTATPLAWVGRPTEVPDARVTGAAALFLAPDAQGLQLVRVHPLLDPADVSRRFGTLVVQTVLARSIAEGAGEGYVLPSAPVRVLVRPRFEGGADEGPEVFLLRDTTGGTLATVVVSADAIAEARASLTRRVRAAQLAVLAVICLLATGPLLDWRRLTRLRRVGVTTTLLALALIAAARLLLGSSVDTLDRSGAPLLSATLPVWMLPNAFFRSSWHFLLSSLTAAGVAALAFSTFDLWRLWRHRAGRRPDKTRAGAALCALVQVSAGGLVAALIVGYEGFLRHGVAAVPFDTLHFALRPWDWPRLAVLTGVIALNIALVGVTTLVYQLAAAPWTLGSLGPAWRLLVAGSWLVVPVTVVVSGSVAGWGPAAPTVLVVGFVVATAWRVPAMRSRFRHASQAVRLLGLILAAVVPSLVVYPSLVDAATRAHRARVESIYAPQVLEQRRTLQAHLSDAMAAVDRLAGLEDLVRASDPDPQAAPPADAAFLVWSQTDLARLRLTSSVELYNTSGALVSRFALKLPDITAGQTATAVGCAWDVFEEVSPFFAEERRLLHAGRAICVTGPDGRPRRVGDVVIHLMLDYSNLLFVSAQSPYLAGLREPRPGLPTPVGFTVYGWSGTVLYASESRAWPMEAAVFERARASRQPFWLSVPRARRTVDAYVLNDRGGVYVLTTGRDTGVGHLTVMAELVALAFMAFVCAVVGALLYARVTSRTPTSGRALLREVRASFYRKLFLAFVAAAVVPVVALAFVARGYFASTMMADIEMEAVRTAEVASRVVEDFGSLQVRGLTALPVIDDNIVVWLSRVIAQDVNIFDGPRLLASSERNLFVSGLLPTRAPGDAYRAIRLDGRPSFVGRESVGMVEYLVAAAPVRVQDRQAMLMVPLTSREQEIALQIEELDRLVLLAATLFIMLGALIGYAMAERIADPVNRLMRATHRIAKGDLDARVIATSSDELQRLVEAFNQMAEDLRRQRAELERTNRLAAWADMARQVAHDIKNPLTPIQLNAEHLQRVHGDRGRPLGSLVDDCVANILGQVRLLRQISSEFSSFASAPEAKVVPVDLAALVQGIVDPYRVGLAGRVEVDVQVSPSLPRVLIDPLLVGRALTNVIENALHAMPGGGCLSIRAACGPSPDEVVLVVVDTGVGMNAEALARIFEPYFSTKTSGTGLGLTIAKRNVEASGGRIGVTSAAGRGTTVTLSFPAAPDARGPEAEA